MKARIDAIIQREQASIWSVYFHRLTRAARDGAVCGEHNVPSADREVATFVELLPAQSSQARLEIEWRLVIRLRISREQSARMDWLLRSIPVTR